MPFDDAGAPGQREAGNDRIEVTVDARRKGVEAGEVVSPDGVEPLRQPFALALGEHPTERPDVAGESIEFAAVDPNGLEPKVLDLGEGLRPTEDPPSADAGCRWSSCDRAR